MYKYKIGILTFQRANNYGAVLQAFALQNYLKSIGCDNVLVDYYCEKVEGMHAFLPLNFHKSLKQNAGAMIWNVILIPRRLMFWKFRRKLRLSKRYYRYNIDQANDEFDVFIVGSDQVFNLNLTDNDLTYYLDFARNEKHKYSYAASMGKMEPSWEQACKKYLLRFDRVSVREKSTVADIQRVTGKDCIAVPDPVFLLNAKEWKQGLGLIDKPKKRYILVYALNHNDELLQYAQKLAQVYKCKLVVITRKVRLLVENARVVRNVSPSKFLNLLRNAELVLGNSFHGVALSLVFRKQFFVQIPKEIRHNSNRITDLLELFNLESRVLNAETNLKDLINYDQIEDKLEQYSNLGKEYLKNIIGRQEI